MDHVGVCIGSSPGGSGCWGELVITTSLLFVIGYSSTIAVPPATALDRLEGRHHAATWRPVWVLVGQQAGGLVGLAFCRTAESYLVSSGIFALVTTVFMLVLHRRTGKAPFVGTQLNSAPCPTSRELIGYSVMGHGGVLVYLYLLRFPLIVLSASIGSAAAGYFSIATAVGETVLIVSQSQLAYVLASATANRTDFSVLRSQLHLGLILSLPAGASLIGAAWLAPMILGPDFSGVQLTVALLMPGIVALGLWRLASYDLASRGLAHMRTSSAMVGAVVMSVLLVVLVKRYGANGAAISASMGYLAMFASLGLMAMNRIRRQTA